MAEGFFWGNDPNVNQELRRRIALQMMSQRKAFPKTIGEGLSAIGDSIGDLGIMRRLEQGDLAQQNAAKAAAAGLLGDDQRSDAGDTSSDTPVRTAYASDSDTPNPPAGYRPAPAYLQAALASEVADPERRAYLGQLAGKEAQSADEVSSTGAAGPFQFTRGTGAQYGLMPNGQDMRGDIHASIAAVQNFTDDNAATLTKMLGRPPSPGELALAHQQGAVTAGRMLLGTGNAPAGNLAVNNVNPGASPQAAAAKIMGYYGMPSASANPRDAIAATLAQRQGGPQPNPTQVGPSAALPLSGSAPAPSGLPPEITQGFSAIRAAPPPPSQIQTAPPVQVAQAAPGEYVMPKPIPPAPPPTVPLSPLGQKALAVIRANPNNDYIVNGTIGDTLKTEMARQQAQQTQLNEDYKARLQHHNTMDTKYQDWLAASEERAQKRTKAPYEVNKLAAETAKAEAEAAAGKVPTTREIGGEVQQYDPVSKTWIKPPGATGSSAPNVSEDQAKNLGYYQRGKRALADLGTGSELNNFLEWHASGMPVIGNYLASTKFQEQYNAAREFAAIVLRRESGAAVTPKETEDVINRYIAKPGTAPEAAIQKQYMREGVMSAIRDALGKATPIADRFDKMFEDEHARLETAKAAAGGKTVAPTDLPPVTITSKEEKDALPVGRRYTLPGDKPGEYRVKK